jgi:hypothetical protein
MRPRSQFPHNRPRRFPRRPLNRSSQQRLQLHRPRWRMPLPRPLLQHPFRLRQSRLCPFRWRPPLRHVRPWWSAPPRHRHALKRHGKPRLLCPCRPHPRRLARRPRAPRNGRQCLRRRFSPRRPGRPLLKRLRPRLRRCPETPRSLSGQLRVARAQARSSPALASPCRAAKLRARRKWCPARRAPLWRRRCRARRI